MATQSAGIFSQDMPFRATKMWNEIVKHFKDGICLKRRRWRMKYYENCFSGEEAVAWLHEYLMNSPNYDTDITRSQAVSLCQKFLQQNVIKDILSQGQTNIVGKTFIESHLYSFCIVSSKKGAESLKENASLKNCSSRKGTPHNKRRKSKLDEVSKVRKPLKDRTSVNNAEESKNGGVLKTRQAKTGKSNDCDLVVANNAVTEPFRIYNDNNTQESCGKQISRKWKSECNLSSVQKSRRDTKEKRANMGKSCSGENISVLPSNGSCGKSVTNDHQGTTSVPKTITKTVCDNVGEEKIHDLWKSICLEQLRYAMKITSFDKVLDVSMLSGKTVEENVKSQYRLVLDVFPKWVISAMKYLIHWPNYCQKTHGKDHERLVQKAIYEGFENDVFKTVTDYFQDVTQPLIPKDFVPLFTKISGLITTCKLSAIRGLQYAFLLLDNEQQRRLQLLYRFMIKISKNQALKLTSVLPVRELVIQTFSPCVFCGDKKTPLTEVLGIRITSFVMDNYCEVFKIPSGFQHKVEQRIAFYRQLLNRDKGDIKQCVPEGIRPSTYCERVTNQDYEEQKRFVTERSLEELLDNIVQDGELNEKERLKKLKQFQKVYPEIYYRRYPSDSLSLMTQNPSTLRHNIMKPLGAMMRNIR